MNIVPVTDNPKAAAKRDEDPNAITNPTQAIISPQLIIGT